MYKVIIVQGSQGIIKLIDLLRQVMLQEIIEDIEKKWIKTE